MQASSLITHSPSSPSFTSYSSGNLADIAARVVRELSDESIQNSNIFSWESHSHFSPPPENNIDGGDNYGDEEDDDDEEEEFEFAIVCREPNGSPISADEIFYNGQIRPIYPLFNTALLIDGEDLSKSKPSSTDASKQTTKPIRSPLGKLFREERETTSCSSSEADDLESVPEGTYCVWNPKKGKEESHGRCKKSSSTGSSKRWKFRDLLYRSNSDGKDTFVFLAPAEKKSSGKVRNVQEGKENNKDKENEKEKEKEKGTVEDHFAKSKAIKEGDKRRSYLPYRRDLVGLFANAHGFSNPHHI